MYKVSCIIECAYWPILLNSKNAKNKNQKKLENIKTVGIFL